MLRLRQHQRRCGSGRQGSTIQVGDNEKALGFCSRSEKISSSRRSFNTDYAASFFKCWRQKTNIQICTIVNKI